MLMVVPLKLNDVIVGQGLVQGTATDVETGSPEHFGMSVMVTGNDGTGSKLNCSVVGDARTFRTESGTNVCGVVELAPVTARMQRTRSRCRPVICTSAVSGENAVVKMQILGIFLCVWKKECICVCVFFLTRKQKEKKKKEAKKEMATAEVSHVFQHLWPQAKRAMTLAVSVLGGLAVLGKGLQMSMTKKVSIGNSLSSNFPILARNEALLLDLERLLELLRIDCGTEELFLQQLGNDVEELCGWLDILATYDEWSGANEVKWLPPAPLLHLTTERVDACLLRILLRDFHLPRIGNDICAVIESLSTARDRVTKNFYLASQILDSQ